MRQQMTSLLLAGAASSCLFVGQSLADAGPLDLKRVMLSTGGVGYFEYEADVSGSAQLNFDVKLDQVNDVLKSLVVYDNQGQVGEITLPGQEPLRETFREMPFSEADLSSPATMFNALRGAEISVSGHKKLRGRILSVTPQETQLPNGLGTVMVHRISVMTQTGIQQFILEDADDVHFEDEKLQKQVTKALAALANNKAKDQRTISVNLIGGKDRKVKIGYVVETPLWKSSYRLTVPSGDKGEEGQLQGWAILENMSGEDWRNIDLSIVSGNPVTYQQSLYNSYYVNRPEIPVEVFGRVMPRKDEGDMKVKSVRSGWNILEDAEEVSVGASSFERLAKSAPAPIAQAKLQAASSQEAATQVVFTVPEKITVSSGESVLVPLVSKKIPMTQVSLYQPDTQETHPLASVEVTNDSDVGLPPGILTLYETDQQVGTTNFVGDAQFAALPSGEKRLISFAVDQKVKIDTRKNRTNNIVQGVIVNGLLRMNTKNQMSYTYTIKGAAHEDRVVILEIPRTRGWSVVSKNDKDLSVTNNYWRLRVNVPAGKTITVPFVVEQLIENVVDLSSLRSDRIGYYLKSAPMSKKAQEALKEIQERSSLVADLKEKIKDLKAQRQDLLTEQKNLRENIRVAAPESDLYDRYMAKMNDIEDLFEQISEQTKDLGKALDKSEKDLKDYLKHLSIK